MTAEDNPEARPTFGPTSRSAVILPSFAQSVFCMANDAAVLSSEKSIFEPARAPAVIVPKSVFGPANASIVNPARPMFGPRIARAEMLSYP